MRHIDQLTMVREVKMKSMILKQSQPLEGGGRQISVPEVRLVYRVSCRTVRE